MFARADWLQWEEVVGPADGYMCVYAACATRAFMHVKRACVYGDVPRATYMEHAY